MLNVFSNRLHDVTRVLAEKFCKPTVDRDSAQKRLRSKGRGEPRETDHFDLHDFVDITMFSSPPTPATVEGVFGSPTADVDISRDGESTCSIFGSRLSHDASEDDEPISRSPLHTLDPRSVFREREDDGVLSDHTRPTIPPSQTPATAVLAKRKLAKAPEVLVEASATKSRRVVRSPPSQHNISTQQHTPESLNIPTKIAKAIASPSSIKQLKDILRIARNKWSPAANAIPSSTKSLWRYLHSLDASSHGNSLLRRIALYRLQVHHDSLVQEFKAREKDFTCASGDARTAVLDIMIAEDADCDNESPVSGPPLSRDNLKEQLHRAKIWHALCERFSVGILFLVPTSVCRGGLSNSKYGIPHYFRHMASDPFGRIERMNKAQVDACFDYISQYREDIVKEAATRAGLIMPLFEGKQCDVVLRLEAERVDDFGEDAETSIGLLELLNPRR